MANPTWLPPWEDPWEAVARVALRPPAPPQPMPAPTPVPQPETGGLEAAGRRALDYLQAPLNVFGAGTGALLGAGLKAFGNDAYERALAQRADAFGAGPDAGLAQSLAIAPPPGTVLAEALAPGTPETAVGRIGKNVGGLLGDIAFDPSNWATGGLAAARGLGRFAATGARNVDEIAPLVQAVRGGGLDEAARLAEGMSRGKAAALGLEAGLGSATAGLVYAPDIALGTLDSARAAKEAYDAGDYGTAAEMAVQAGLTGGLGGLMLRGVREEARSLRRPPAAAPGEPIAPEPTPAPEPGVADFDQDFFGGPGGRPGVDPREAFVADEILFGTRQPPREEAGPRPMDQDFGADPGSRMGAERFVLEPDEVIPPQRGVERADPVRADMGREPIDIAASRQAQTPANRLTVADLDQLIEARLRRLRGGDEESGGDRAPQPPPRPPALPGGVEPRLLAPGVKDETPAVEPGFGPGRVPTLEDVTRGTVDLNEVRARMERLRSQREPVSNPYKLDPEAPAAPVAREPEPPPAPVAPAAEAPSPSPRQRVFDAYVKRLRATRTEDEARVVAERILASPRNLSVNPTLQAALRDLGVKPTIKAFREFLGEPEARPEPKPAPVPKELPDDGLDGFSNAAPPMRRAKIKQALSRTMRVNAGHRNADGSIHPGDLVKSGDYIREAVKKGWRVQDVRGEPRFTSPDGGFMEQGPHGINATEMAYARYLSERVQRPEAPKAPKPGQRSALDAVPEPQRVSAREQATRLGRTLDPNRADPDLVKRVEAELPDDLKPHAQAIATSAFNRAVARYMGQEALGQARADHGDAGPDGISIEGQTGDSFDVVQRAGGKVVGVANVRGNKLSMIAGGREMGSPVSIKPVYAEVDRRGVERTDSLTEFGAETRERFEGKSDGADGSGRAVQADSGEAVREPGGVAVRDGLLGEEEGGNRAAAPEGRADSPAEVARVSLTEPQRSAADTYLLDPVFADDPFPGTLRDGALAIHDLERAKRKIAEAIESAQDDAERATGTEKRLATAAVRSLQALADKLPKATERPAEKPPVAESYEQAAERRRTLADRAVEAKKRGDELEAQRLWDEARAIILPDRPAEVARPEQAPSDAQLLEWYAADLPSRDGLSSMPINRTWERYKAANPSAGPEAFKARLLELWQEGKISLARHDVPSKIADRSMLPVEPGTEAYRPFFYWTPVKGRMEAEAPARPEAPAPRAEAVEAPPVRGQKRAESGGEVGPNGEWYPGGAFIATTDAPKQARADVERIARMGNLDDVPIGEAPVGWLRTSEYLLPNGDINRPRFEYLQRTLPGDAFKRIVALAEDASERWKRGERTVRIVEHPEYARPQDVARMALAGQAIPGAALDAVAPQIRAKIEAILRRASDERLAPAPERPSAEPYKSRDAATEALAPMRQELKGQRITLDYAKQTKRMAGGRKRDAGDFRKQAGDARAVQTWAQAQRADIEARVQATESLKRKSASQKAGLDLARAAIKELDKLITDAKSAATKMDRLAGDAPKPERVDPTVRAYREAEATPERERTVEQRRLLGDVTAAKPDDVVDGYLVQAVPGLIKSGKGKVNARDQMPTGFQGVRTPGGSPVPPKQIARGIAEDANNRDYLAAKRSMRDTLEEVGPNPDDPRNHPINQLGDAAEPAEGDASFNPDEFGAEAPAPEGTGRIDDVGEKIGGARKDLAVSTGPRSTVPKPERETGWRGRYEVSEIAAGRDKGKFGILDRRDRGRWPYVSRTLFDTREEAERALPLAALAHKHAVYGQDGAYSIYRNVADRKRVKVVGRTFATRDEAMRYMAENADQILNTKTSFGEEILPRERDDIRREGAPRRQGDVKPEDFRSAFGFRGVEFGNWNNQAERQQVLNHAYDGLADLADALGVPPRALSLNGELGLAFGARGQGLSGAVAHYEREYGVINLTKMSGSGALAHEWFHGLDHYLGRQDGKTARERVQNSRGDMVYPTTTRQGSFATHGFQIRKSGVRPELQEAFERLVKSLFQRAEKYVQDTRRVDEWLGQAREQVAQRLDAIRRNLAEPQQYGFKKKPATPEQLARFDELAQKIINGEALELRSEKPPRGGRFSSRWTNDALNGISGILKEVRGREGWAQGGWLNGVADSIRLYASRLKDLTEAQKGSEKERRIPTEFVREARKLDQGRATDYWSEPHEMAARAFEAFVFDKIKDGGNRSDFLVSGTRGAIPTPFGDVRPYPEGAERAEINAAFQKLMDTFKTREDEAGNVMMFQRPAPGQRGMFVDDVPTEAPKKAKPQQTSMFGQGAMLVPSETRVTEGREADGPLFKQDEDARIRAEKKAQRPLFQRPEQPDEVRIEQGRFAMTQGKVRAVSADGKTSNWHADEADARAELKQFQDAAKNQVEGEARYQEALDNLLRGEPGETGILLSERPYEGQVIGLLREAGMTVAEARKQANRLASGTNRNGGNTFRASDVLDYLRGRGRVGKKAQKPLFQRAETREQDDLGFYSALREAVSDVKAPKVGTGAEWDKFLRNPQRGVKPDEMKWTGLDDYLRENAGKRLTREDVTKFLAENRVEIREVRRGATYVPEIDAAVEKHSPTIERAGYRLEGETENDLPILMDSTGNAVMYGREVVEDDNGRPASVPEDVQAAYRAIVKATEANPETKFDKYTLPGGESYREVLLTLPVRGMAPGFKAFKADDGSWGVEFPDGFKVRGFPSEAAAIRSQRSQPGNPNFHSSHWDEPNVIAHLRLNDRTDADGKRVLFVEEVQSDWAQKGRSEGFRDPEKHEAEIVALRQKNLELYRQLEAIRLEEQGPREEWKRLADSVPLTEDGTYREDTPEYAEMDAAEKRLREIVKRRLPIEAQIAKTAEEMTKKANRGPMGLAPAPFVTSTDKWTELALKRVLRMAAEGGYDRVSWTTGKDQAERYKLSKQVDSVSFTPWPAAGEGYGILVARKGGAEVVKETIPASKLDSYIGKEVAEKLLAEPPDGVGRRSLSGEGLDIGGKGMVGYYDQIIPKAFERLGRKWGVKAGAGTVPLTAPDGRIYARASDGSTSRRPDAGESTAAAVHSINVTPEMKASVMQGQPLFQQTTEAAWSNYNGRTDSERRSSYTQAAKAAEEIPGSPLKVADFEGDVSRSVLDGLKRDTAPVARALSAAAKRIEALAGIRVPLEGFAPAGNMRGVNFNQGIWLNVLRHTEMASERLRTHHAGLTGKAARKMFARLVANRMLQTLRHEAAHHASRGHGAEFKREMVRIQLAIGAEHERLLAHVQRALMEPSAGGRRVVDSLESLVVEARPGWAKGEARGKARAARGSGGDDRGVLPAERDGRGGAEGVLRRASGTRGDGGGDPGGVRARGADSGRVGEASEVGGDRVALREPRLPANDWRQADDETLAEFADYLGHDSGDLRRTNELEIMDEFAAERDEPELRYNERDINPDTSYGGEGRDKWGNDQHGGPAATDHAAINESFAEFLRERGDADALPSDRDAGRSADDLPKREAQAEAEAYPLGRTDPRREANFRRWFGDSKVVDKDGKPLVVYHGTTSEFGAFDKGKQAPGALYGPGFYFTESPEVAGGRVGKVSEGRYFPTKEAAEAARDAEYGNAWNKPEVSRMDALEPPEWFYHTQRPGMVADGYASKGHSLEVPVVTKAIRESPEYRILMGKWGGLSADEKRRAEKYLSDAEAQWKAGERGPSTLVSLLENQPYNLHVRQILERAGLDSAGSVIPAHLSIKSPIDLDAKMDKATATRLADAIEKEFGWAPGPFGQRITNLGVSVDVSRRDAFMQSVGQSVKAALDGVSNHVSTGKPGEPFGAKFHQRLFRAAGYDGITHIGGGITGGDKHRVWIAFDPEQIKSATGNRGSYSPDDPRMAYQRPTRTGAAFGQTAAGTTVVSAETKWKKLQRLIQDRFNRFATVQKDAVDATGRMLDPKADVYDAEIRFHGRTAERIRTYGQKYTDKLVDWMRASKVSDTDLGDYMTLLHKPDRDAALAGVVPPGTMGPRGAASGWTQADANARWAELEAKYGARVNGAIPALQPGRQIIRDMIRERERLLLHYGLADRATLRGWRQKYGPDYVPQRDFEGDDEVGQGVGRGFDVRGAEAVPAMGRSTHADNPVAWATHQLLRTVIRGEKERVARAAYRLAKRYPELGIEINKKHMKGGQRDFRAEQNDFVVKIKGRGGKLKQVRLTFPDPLLHRALQGLDAEQSHVIVDGLGKVTRAYTQLVTSWSPEFIFSNLSRDAQQAFATLGVEKGNDIAKKLPKYMPGAMKGMWQILRDPAATGGWATWAKEFREDGGAAGWYNLKPAEELAKDFAGKVSEGEVKRRLGKAVQMVEDANATIENGTRLAAYRALRESGMPRTQAATYVKGMTLNFNKRGELGQAFNSLYAFSNASVQGVKRLGEVLNSPKGRAVAASIMGLGLTMDLINRSMAGDDDKDGTNDYDAIPDFVKERNLIIPTGGKPLTIPLPYGFNVLYAAGANLSAVLSGAKTAGQGAGAVATALTSMMNPLGASPSWAQALSPTILDPIAQISENQDFAGNAVRPDRYPGDRRPDSQLFFKTVSPTAKWLAEAFNTATGGDKVTPGLVDVSPETLELLSGFVTGGLGRFLRQSVEAGGMALSGELPSVRQTPFARRVLYDEHPGALSGRYREMVADLEQAEDQFEYALKQKDIERAKSLRKQVQLKKLVVNDIESQIKKLRKLGDMSPKLKDKADEKIRALQASAMRRYERAQA